MDPIKDGGNWYQYCYSNLLKYWDPTGLKGFSLFECNDINDITDWFHSNVKGMQRVLQGLGGVLQTVGSAFQIYLGVTAVIAAITASAPVSLPILIAAIAGGTAIAIFGGSNLVEGLHNISNAIKGDSTSGFNFIRDTFFENNPWLYYLLNIIAGSAASYGKSAIASSSIQTGQNALRNGDSKAISSMSKEQLQANLPEGWTYTEHNGRVHIKDANGNFRVRIDPPDKVTNYQHMHILDELGNPLDINGNIVSPKSPDGHIPWNN